MKISTVIPFLLCALLSSCGGGGASSNANNTSSQNSTSSQSNPTPSSAEGVYSGKTSTGLTFEAIILPNQKFYAVYGPGSGNTFYAQGIVVGQGTSSNGQYTASITDYYYTGLANAGSVTASYVAGSSISGTLSESGLSETFNGATIPVSSFNYDTTALLSNIMGQWTGKLQDGSTANVTIYSNGSFTGSDSGCSFTGTTTPDSSNKNFFNLSVTFGTSPCLLPNQTATGVGVDYLLSDGVTHQLLVGVSTGSYGTIFVANR